MTGRDRDERPARAVVARLDGDRHLVGRVVQDRVAVGDEPMRAVEGDGRGVRLVGRAVHEQQDGPVSGARAGALGLRGRLRHVGREAGREGGGGRGARGAERDGECDADHERYGAAAAPKGGESGHPWSPRQGAVAERRACPGEPERAFHAVVTSVVGPDRTGRSEVEHDVLARL
jgi:hypothetical protein